MRELAWSKVGTKTSHIVTDSNTVRCSPTGCLYSGGSEHRSILPESKEMVKLSPRGSRIPVTVTGEEGELPSIPSGEREGDRQQRLIVVICGNGEEEKCEICYYDNCTELQFFYLHFARVEMQLCCGAENKNHVQCVDWESL